MAKVRLILFDVNETLLDLSALDAHFARAFGEASSRETRFHSLQQLFLTAQVIGRYQRFDKLADAALDMVGSMRQTVLSGTDRDAIMLAMRHLPAHADVLSALRRLAASGLRLAILSNSPRQAVTAQIQQAGLAEFFEAILSADDVGHYKPASAAYEYAAKAMALEQSAPWESLSFFARVGPSDRQRQISLQTTNREVAEACATDYLANPQAPIDLPPHGRDLSFAHRSEAAARIHANYDHALRADVLVRWLEQVSQQQQEGNATEGDECATDPVDRPRPKHGRFSAGRQYPRGISPASPRWRYRLLGFSAVAKWHGAAVRSCHGSGDDAQPAPRADPVADHDPMGDRDAPLDKRGYLLREAIQRLLATALSLAAQARVQTDTTAAVRWTRLALTLLIVDVTGRRIGGVRQLRRSDLQFVQRGAGRELKLTFRGDTLKGARQRTIPFPL
jgi:2-haloacid dehalogenase